MILLSSLIKQFESAFLRQYSEQILPSHRKALTAMAVCRTPQSLRMRAGCSQCDHTLTVPHSCGHRHCPHCQNHESQQWLERQLKKQVPAAYFLLTFTLPAEFRPLAWRHQRQLYALMIQCVWETVRTFAQNDKQLQGIPGAIAVLHTHSRRLDFHPHVHLVMPAAAMDVTNKLWRTKGQANAKTGYLFNHKALAKVFRAKLLEAIIREGLMLPAKYPKTWVVDCKSVGSGGKALVYLGRYLYRGVIQEKDIVACRDGKVTFRYQNSKTKQWESRTVTGTTFLWLILQHVLPKGFRRARNFGYLHPNSKRLIRLLQYLLGLDPNRALRWIKKRPQWVCPCCGAPMKVIETRLPPLFTFSNRGAM
ncbi:MAG TPA: transposase [Gammaproteobacteria bacterium]|nr:transposase [Gammaproteobacteria bacterium]